MSVNVKNPVIDKAAESLSALGQPMSDEQKLYLDGFVKGLQIRGVSIKDQNGVDGIAEKPELRVLNSVS
ncbi:MAG: hypothetical protein AAGA18_05610 [Verrucomicrobiota bacterium]